MEAILEHLSYELGSMVLVAVYILWQLIKWAKSRGMAEANEEYTSNDIKKLATKMDDACDKIANTHTEVTNIYNDIHNGLSSDIKDIKDSQIREWKAINANTSNVSYLMGKERRKS